jgi:uncharacterized protein (TIGR03083 family)
LSTLADRSIAALRANYDDLAARVRTFDDADLERQSGASEWSVAQVLSHLGSGAEIATVTLQAARSGDGPPDADFNRSVWDRWNDMSPREQAEGFLESAGQAIRTLEELDATERQELKIDLGFLPVPLELGVYAAMRLGEATMHGWDVRVAFDRSATLPAPEPDIAIEGFRGPLGFMLGFIGKPDRLDVQVATLRVETTNPDLQLGLVISPTVAFVDAPADADGVLVTPAEALHRLIAGRLGPSHTPSTVVLTSDVVTLDDLRQLFPGL